MSDKPTYYPKFVAVGRYGNHVDQHLNAAMPDETTEMYMGNGWMT